MAKGECPGCGSPVVEKKGTRGMVRFECTKTLNPNCKSNGYVRHDKKEAGSTPGTPAKEIIKPAGNNDGTIKPNPASAGKPAGDDAGKPKSGIIDWIDRTLKDIGGY